MLKTLAKGGLRRETSWQNDRFGLPEKIKVSVNMDAIFELN